MDVKVGLSHWGKNIQWQSLGTGCEGSYLDLKDEGTRSWRDLHKEEFHDFQLAPNNIEEDETGRTSGTCGDNKNAYKILVKKPEKKKTDHMEWRLKK